MSGRPPDVAGILTVRDGRIVFASDGVAALAGRAPAEMVGRAFRDFIVEEDRALVEERHARRTRGEPVPNRYEITIALPQGGRRRVELHVELRGAETLVHVHDVAVREARRLRLDAVAKLGASLQRELAEEGVHARLRDDLAALGLTCGLLRAEAGGVRVVWAAPLPSMGRKFDELVGGPMDGFLARWTPFSRAVFAEGWAYTEDWGNDAALFLPEALQAEARAALTTAARFRAVAVRLGDADADHCLVVIGEWLGADDAPALRLLAAQLSAALAAARTIADLSRRNAELAALNRVAELAGEAPDLATFLSRTSEVLRGAAACKGTAVFVLDEGAGALVLAYGDGVPEPVTRAFERLPLSSPLGAIMAERSAGVVDAADAPDPNLRRIGFRSIARIPLTARSRPVGILAAGFAEPAAEVRGRLGLLGAVGAHVAAALESHALLSDLRRRVSESGRLFAEAKRRASDLEAVNALALRMFEAAPGDLPALLEAGCREIAGALSVRAAVVFLAEPGGATLRGAAGWGAPLDPVQLVIEIDRDGLAREAMRARAPAFSADVTADPASSFHRRAGMPPLAMLAVPLGSRAETPGVLFLADEPGRAFGPPEVALATALAGELGMGLENARLYADERRRVEELSFLNEFARTIAASLDLDDVLREGADAARRLVDATHGAVLLHDPLRGELRLAGAAGFSPPPGRRVVVPLAGGTAAARAVLERRPIVVDDATVPGAVDEAYRRALEPRTVVAAPVLLRGEPLAVLVVDQVRPERRFGVSDVERITAVANQLAVALENARLYSETRRRAEELGLLHEVGRSLVETLDIQQLLDRGVQNLARIVDAPNASLLLATGDGKAVEVRAVAGEHSPHLGLRLPVDPPEGSLAALVFSRREPVVIEDALGDPRVNEQLRSSAKARGYLGLPLVVHERTIGAVIIMEPRGPRRFTPAEVERAAAIANQLAVAVENARLYEDLRQSYAALERAQHRLIGQERLAALGELSAVVAHEVRNPLGVIFNSLGSLRRLVRPTGDAKLLLDIVGEEADRLNRIVGDLLDFARPSTPELRPERLDRIADEAVAAALAQRPPGLEIQKELDPSVPPIPIDARLVRQAVLNVVVNAVQAMPRGGRITIRTRRGGDAVVLEIEDTGAGVSDEVSARIFEPFFTTKASGTGLGLAVVKRIVEGHGGAVAVRNRPGAGAVFSLSFPLAAAPVENEPAMG